MAPLSSTAWAVVLGAAVVSSAAALDEISDARDLTFKVTIGHSGHATVDHSRAGVAACATRAACWTI